MKIKNTAKYAKLFIFSFLLFLTGFSALPDDNWTVKPDTSWSTRVKAFWDPKARLEKNGKMLVSGSLFNAIEENDLDTVKDLLAVLPTKEIQGAEKIDFDPGLEIFDTLKMDRDYLATFYNYDESIKARVRAASGGAPLQVSINPLGDAVAQVVKMQFRVFSHDDDRKRANADEIVHLLLQHFKSVRPNNLKFVLAWCDIGNQVATNYNDKSSKQFKLLQEDSIKCFNLSKQLLALNIDASKEAWEGSWPHYYLYYLLFALKEYDEKTIRNHFQYWIERLSNKLKSNTKQNSLTVKRADLNPNSSNLISLPFHPLMMLADAPLVILNHWGDYDEGTQRVLVSLMGSLGDKDFDHEWLFKTALAPYYSGKMENTGISASGKNSHIYDYVSALKSRFGESALNDCKSGKSIYACWATEELIHVNSVKRSPQDGELLCSKGVGYACQGLSFRLTLDEENLKFPDKERDADIQLIQKQCHNNLYYACSRLLKIKKKFPSKFPGKKYKCSKDTIEDCFLIADSSKNITYMDKACALENVDACYLMFTHEISLGLIPLGRTYLEKACKLQELQENVRPYDWLLCNDKDRAIRIMQGMSQN